MVTVLSSVVHRALRSVRAIIRVAIRYLCEHSFRYLLGLLTVLLSLIGLMLPSAYMIEEPGLTQDVLANMDGKQVIRLAHEPKRESQSPHAPFSGRLLMVTISANGVPGYEVPTIYALTSWLHPQRVVLPREVAVPPAQDPASYAAQAQQEMQGAQSSAQRAAADYAQRWSISLKPNDIQLFGGDIGGPSAGMMYALGILTKAKGDLKLNGKTIAGTGTIDNHGRVGAIGGIRLKMLAAKRDGAQWFLAPNANCDEVVDHVPEGLRVVSVANLDEAYRALQAITSGKHVDRLASCKVA